MLLEQVSVLDSKKSVKQVLDEAVAKDPKNPLLWEMAGRFQSASGKPAEAEAAFVQATRLKPGYVRAHCDLDGVVVQPQRWSARLQEDSRLCHHTGECNP